MDRHLSSHPNDTGASPSEAEPTTPNTAGTPPTPSAQGEAQTPPQDAANDRYLRALAEFENTKKRLHREKEEYAKYASETLLRELLPIVDSLDQALVAVDKQSDSQAIIKGIHLIYRQLLGLLEKEGVKRIATIGEPFDPHRHEAVGEVETHGTPAEGTVAEEVHVGYTMHGKVIRPAMVKVAKKSSPQSIVHSPQKESNCQGNAEEKNTRVSKEEK